MTEAVKVAFIDDGICEAFVDDDTVFESYIVADGSVQACEHKKDILTHGTICYKVFKDRVGSRYDLSSVQILDDRMYSTDIDSLILALKWCNQNSIKLINLSLGTKIFFDIDKLLPIINDLAEAGVIIVCACNNSNTITFPACFENVIGVRHDTAEIYKTNFLYLPNPYDKIDIIAYSESMHVTLYEKDYSCDMNCFINKDMAGNCNRFDITNVSQSLSSSPCNSNAAPLITAIICNLIAEGITDLKNIRSELVRTSLKGEQLYTYEFCKSKLRSWKKMKVPIVLYDCEQDADHSKEFILELLGKFKADGYQAVCFTDLFETDIASHFFNITYWKTVSLGDNIDLYFNFTDADIIVMILGKSRMDEILELTQPDVIITERQEYFSGGNSLLLYTKDCVLSIYNKMIGHLT
ncbi:MAG: in-like serine protease [Herbinix sp.]|jgi:hypothetical protein|nr:in-like serine protease [Herbinix sp.]